MLSRHLRGPESVTSSLFKCDTLPKPPTAPQVRGDGKLPTNHHGCGEIPRHPLIGNLLWLDRCERVGDPVVVQVGEALEAGVGAHDQPRAPRVVGLHGHGRA